MNDFIFNILPAQGPTVPMSAPIFGGFPINSPLVGSIIAIVVSVAIAAVTIKRTGDSNRRYINAVEETSQKQISETRHWMNLKRKLLLKSLIEELEHNVWVYNELMIEVERKEYHQLFFNFILVTTEKCLGDTPIDDDELNKAIMVLYFVIKVHDNKISATRTPSISEDSLKNLLDGIVDDYKAKQTAISNAIESLKIYESQMKVE